MSHLYYSTKTVLDWLLGHYFFDGRHIAWFAPKFSPYRLKIPIRCNPLRVYEALYAAWKDADDKSPFLADKRLNLRKAIEMLAQAGNIDPTLATKLKSAVDSAD